MNNESQNKAIRAALEAGESITPIDALSRFNCFRLGARIYDLRRAGMKIVTETVCKNGKRFARYMMDQA